MVSSCIWGVLYAVQRWCSLNLHFVIFWGVSLCFCSMVNIKLFLNSTNSWYLWLSLYWIYNAQAIWPKYPMRYYAISESKLMMEYCFVQTIIIFLLDIVPEALMQNTDNLVLIYNIRSHNNSEDLYVVFCLDTSYSLVSGYQHFGGMYFLSLQNESTNKREPAFTGNLKSIFPLHCSILYFMG
jgi:hypothetical protein